MKHSYAPSLVSKDSLEDFARNGLSKGETAERIGCPKSTVSRLATRYGIEFRHGNSIAVLSDDNGPDPINPEMYGSLNETIERLMSEHLISALDKALSEFVVELNGEAQ